MPSTHVHSSRPQWGGGVVAATPCALFNLTGLEERLRHCAAGAEARGITLAYSVKTNPMLAILERVRAAGMAAEAISGAEVDAALHAGFTPGQVVLGGVAKAWPNGAVTPGLLALLDDTLDGFHAGVLARAGHRYHCVRLRFPDVGSRLGLDTSTGDSRRQLAAALLDAHARGLSVGLATHEHYVPAAEADTWFARVRSLLDGLADTDPRATDVVECLDLGGGYNAACLDELLRGDLGKDLLAYVHDRLPQCRTVILEPGKSLVQAYGAVVATVLAQQSPDEVCVDASMAELPWPMTRRPVSVWRHGRWEPLAEGAGVIGGRCTAETDVLATAVDITGLTPGDRLLFANAGAYDWSMRSAFGTATVIETSAANDATA
jgi:diaminopimelate decarboxylase